MGRYHIEAYRDSETGLHACRDEAPGAVFYIFDGYAIDGRIVGEATTRAAAQIWVDSQTGSNRNLA